MCVFGAYGERVGSVCMGNCGWCVYPPYTRHPQVPILCVWGMYGWCRYGGLVVRVYMGDGWMVCVWGVGGWGVVCVCWVDVGVDIVFIWDNVSVCIHVFQHRASISLGESDCNSIYRRRERKDTRVEI